jgi:hypothetical protein
LQVEPTRLINLTPHPVTLMTGGPTRKLTVVPEGTEARVRMEREWIEDLSTVGRVPIYRTEFTEVLNLPSPEPGTRYIVSSVVADACPDRDDLLVPDDRIRDENKRIVGARGLRINHSRGVK